MHRHSITDASYTSFHRHPITDASYTSFHRHPITDASYTSFHRHPITDASYTSFHRHSMHHYSLSPSFRECCPGIDKHATNPHISGNKMPGPPRATGVGRVRGVRGGGEVLISHSTLFIEIRLLCQTFLFLWKQKFIRYIFICKEEFSATFFYFYENRNFPPHFFFVFMKIGIFRYIFYFYENRNFPPHFFFRF